MLLETLHRTGSLICHQFPQRSLFLYHQSFVCARDLGIYFGAFLGLVFLLKYRRPEPGLALSVFFLPLAIDGITEYAGLQPSSNFARLWTGLYFGIGLTLLLAGIATRDLEQKPLPPLAYILSFALSILILPLFYTSSLFLFSLLNTVSFISLLGLTLTLVYLGFGAIHEGIKKPN